ncbi:hypothetical protein FHW94_000421 [Novosphingobium sp. SG720]|nr:hypothetical protein [Novosphingobium sp. SG720]
MGKRWIAAGGVMRHWNWGAWGQSLRGVETGKALRANARQRGAALWALAGLVLAAAGMVPPSAQAQAAPGPDATDKTMELEFWRGVAGSSDPALYEAYLQQFPNGTFAPLARVKLTALHRVATPGQAPAQGAPAPVSAPAPAPAPPAAAAVPLPVPVPAPVPVAAAAPPVVALPAPPVAAAPVAVFAPVPAGGAASGDSADAKVLAMLAAMQETPAVAASQPAPPPPPPPPPPIELPLTAAHDFTADRPQLAAVPAVVLPARFCSAEERNAFHAQVYSPANDVAQANLQKANAYLQAIQSRYDAMAMGDADTRNALSKEGTEYKRLADAAFAQQQALVRQFSAIMAVPITPCGDAK